MVVATCTTLWRWMSVTTITNSALVFAARTLIVSIPVVHNFSDSITIHPLLVGEMYHNLYKLNKR